MKPALMIVQPKLDKVKIYNVVSVFKSNNFELKRLTELTSLRVRSRNKGYMLHVCLLYASCRKVSGIFKHQMCSDQQSPEAFLNMLLNFHVCMCTDSIQVPFWDIWDKKTPI